MRKKIFEIVGIAEDYIENGDINNKEEISQYINRWIGYFQHERLIHLIVTVCFAIMSLMSIFGFYITENIMFVGVVILFVITTGFYVEHYFILENKTQYLYTLYDKILNK